MAFPPFSVRAAAWSRYSPSRLRPLGLVFYSIVLRSIEMARITKAFLGPRLHTSDTLLSGETTVSL